MLGLPVKHSSSSHTLIFALLCICIQESQTVHDDQTPTTAILALPPFIPPFSFFCICTQESQTEFVTSNHSPQPSSCHPQLHTISVALLFIHAQASQTEYATMTPPPPPPSSLCPHLHPSIFVVSKSAVNHLSWSVSAFTHRRARLST